MHSFLLKNNVACHVCNYTALSDEAEVLDNSMFFSVCDLKNDTFSIFQQNPDIEDFESFINC